MRIRDFKLSHYRIWGHFYIGVIAACGACEDGEPDHEEGGSYDGK